MNKNFEKHKDFLLGHTYNFKIIVLTETWLKDEDTNKNSPQVINSDNSLYFLDFSGFFSLFLFSSYWAL